MSYAYKVRIYAANGDWYDYPHEFLSATRAHRFAAKRIPRGGRSWVRKVRISDYIFSVA